MHYVMLMALFPLLPFSSASDEYRKLHVGKEFTLQLRHWSLVVLIPRTPPGPKRTILEDGLVMDPRFELTSDRRLILREVNQNDSGLYYLTRRHSFMFDTIDLTVSGKPKEKTKEEGGTHETWPDGRMNGIGAFVFLAGLILLCCFTFGSSKDGDGSPTDAPRINDQDYSPDVPPPSVPYTRPQQPATARKWSPKASPLHRDHTPVAIDHGIPLSPSNGRAGNKWGTSLLDHKPAHPAPTTIGDSFAAEQKESFPMPWASDCLHTSEDCVQFQSRDQDRRRQGADFSAPPLYSETAEDSVVYTSDKLNAL